MPQYNFIIQTTVFTVQFKSFWQGFVNRIQIHMEKSSRQKIVTLENTLEV